MATETDCDSKVKSYLRRKYSYMSEDDISDILGQAKMFYFKGRFPSLPDASETDYPIEGNNIFWIEKATDELIEREGICGATEYQENSISIKFGVAELSQTLRDQLIPETGYVGSLTDEESGQ